jgi:murein DD-endopeptidase MepM/ murein hydrolase activator NlpD
VRLTWPPGSAEVTDVAVGFGQQLARVVRVSGGAKAIVPVALDSTAGEHDLAVSVTDEFGQVHTVHMPVAVREFPEPVELLHLEPDVLALSTPAAKELERTTLDRVFAATPPQPAWHDTFGMPIEGVSTSGFGSPRRYAPGGRVSYHEGLDLAAPTGTPIHATNAGTVVVAGPFPIKGNLVVIDHGDGVFSLYFHQSKILVRVGNHVERGDIVGLVGTTGLSTGPHLHWEVRVDGVPTNPLAWVGKTFP